MFVCLELGISLQALNRNNLLTHKQRSADMQDCLCFQAKCRSVSGLNVTTALPVQYTMSVQRLRNEEKQGGDTEVDFDFFHVCMCVYNMSYYIHMHTWKKSTSVSPPCFASFLILNPPNIQHPT